MLTNLILHFIGFTIVYYSLSFLIGLGADIVVPDLPNGVFLIVILSYLASRIELQFSNIKFHLKNFKKFMEFFYVNLLLGLAFMVLLGMIFQAAGEFMLSVYCAFYIAYIIAKLFSNQSDS